MKYYAGHLDVQTGSVEFERCFAIAANEPRQAQALMEAEGRSHVEQYPQDSVRTIRVREVSPVTYQELSTWCPTLGTNGFSLEALESDERAKALAHRLGGALKRLQAPVAHGKLLHAVAASLGETDWQVLHAQRAPAEPDIAAEGPALTLYVDARTPAPPSNVAWPLDEELWRPYVDNNDALVTFTVMIPLKEVVEGHRAIVSYCEEAFDRKVLLACPEFRVVGHALANDDFDEEYSGDLQLQVTCALQSL